MNPLHSGHELVNSLKLYYKQFFELHVNYNYDNNIDTMLFTLLPLNSYSPNIATLFSQINLLFLDNFGLDIYQLRICIHYHVMFENEHEVHQTGINFDVDDFKGNTLINTTDNIIKHCNDFISQLKVSEYKIFKVCFYKSQNCINTLNFSQLSL